MRALTVRQPFAGSIFILGKDVENRSWTTPYRGPLIIHASSAPHELSPFTLYKNLELSESAFSENVLSSPGKILGVVDLVDIVQDSTSMWAMGNSYHWVLENPRPLASPIAARGAMSLWTPPSHILEICSRYL